MEHFYFISDGSVHHQLALFISTNVLTTYIKIHAPRFWSFLYSKSTIVHLFWKRIYRYLSWDVSIYKMIINALYSVFCMKCRKTDNRNRINIIAWLNANYVRSRARHLRKNCVRGSRIREHYILCLTFVRSRWRPTRYTTSFDLFTATGVLLYFPSQTKYECRDECTRGFERYVINTIASTTGRERGRGSEERFD